MEGLWFKYQDHFERNNKFKVGSYCLDGSTSWTNGHDKVCPDEGKYFVIKCPCGSLDWNEDGRFMNEYQCNCCSQFIEVVEER